MASDEEEVTFTLYAVPYNHEDALEGKVGHYYVDKYDATESMYDAYECGLSKIEVKVVSHVEMIVPIEKFKTLVRNVDDVQGAWQDYAESGLMFDEWWNKSGKKVWGIEVEDAMAALKELLGGTP